MNIWDSIDFSQYFVGEIRTSSESYVDSKLLLLDFPLWEKVDTG